MRIEISRQEPFDVPVLLICYHRLDTLKLVLGQIAKVRPRRLYVFADGPRADRPEDDRKTQDVREYIDSHIDWSCELHRMYQEANKGCRIGPPGAISEVLSREESVIIVEDDMYCDPSFFYFCRAMLERYRDDQRVMMISGLSVRAKDCFGENDAVFSLFSSIWGWATWRRAWNYYDVDVRDWPEARRTGKLQGLFTPDAYEQIRHSYNNCLLKKYPNWDYQWDFARHLRNGLGIIPKSNLVRNIGFEQGSGEHDFDVSKMPEMKIEPIGDAIEMPEQVKRSMLYDTQFMQEFYPHLTPRARIVRNTAEWIALNLPGFWRFLVNSKRKILSVLRPHSRMAE